MEAIKNGKIEGFEEYTHPWAFHGTLIPKSPAKSKNPRIIN
jgi:hypothetical protein